MKKYLCSMKILGVKLNPFPICLLNQAIEKAVDNKDKIIVSNHNLHSVYLFHQESKMRQFYDLSKIIHIDGMPLVWLGRLLGYPVNRENRVTYVDWIKPLLAEAEKKGWRIYYLGSRPGVAAKGVNILKNEFKNLDIQAKHGYFDVNSPQNQNIVNEINNSEINVLLVGMGMPRQEYWIMDNYQGLNVNAILPCGACIDYIAGEVPTPPRWMGQIGLEWLYRLLSEPKRLWQRYLVEPWSILPLVFKDIKEMSKKVSG